MSKIIFFGNEQLAQGIKSQTPIFDALLSTKHQICALVLPAAHTRQPFKIIKIAEANHIPIHFVAKKTELLPLIKQYQPDLGVLAAFGKIIPQEVIDAIPCGIINIHPSLLPKYRGTTPIETALLNDDSETGVSIMRLTAEMDAGPILAQKSITISPSTNKQTLYDQLSALGAKLLLSVLDGTLTKNAPETSQNGAEATFTTKLTKDLSNLDFASKAAKTLSNEIRAYAGFPKSKAVLLGTPCTITAAHVADQPITELDQLCRDGKYLVIDRLIPENSKEMDAKSFLNGHKNKLS